MTAAHGLITVWLDVPAARDEEFNAWYNLEHIPQMSGLAGFVRARRYRAEGSPLPYLAWYDTVDEAVEPGPAFQGVVANPTPWSQRIRTFYGDRRERMNFRLMRDVGTAPAQHVPAIRAGRRRLSGRAEGARGRDAGLNWLKIALP